MTDQLISALKAGDKEALMEILQDSPEHINAILTEHKATPFEVALDYGFTAIAEMLIKLPGFDLNHSDHNPLRLSIDLGYLDIAEQLLEIGANPNYRPQQMSSALLLCLDNEYFQLAELMVEKGAEVNIRNDLSLIHI